MQIVALLFTAAQQWNKLPSHDKNSTNIKKSKKTHQNSFMPKSIL